MPTTAIAVQDIVGGYSTTGAAVTMTAADVANGNHFVAAGTTLVIAQNTNTTTPYTVTIVSEPDATTGRSGDVSAQSLAASEIRHFNISIPGWADTADSNKVLISASNAAIKFGLIKIRS